MEVKEFRFGHIYDMVKKECYLSGVQNDYAKFECYEDLMFTYSITKDSVKHEFSFFSPIDGFSLRSKMYVIDILNLNCIETFKHTIYLHDNINGWVFDSYMLYNSEALND